MIESTNKHPGHGCLVDEEIIERRLDNLLSSLALFCHSYPPILGSHAIPGAHFTGQYTAKIESDPCVFHVIACEGNLHHTSAL